MAAIDPPGSGCAASRSGDRRSFLRLVMAGGGLAGAGVLAGGAAAAGPVTDSVEDLIGYVERASADRLQLRTNRGPVPIMAAPQARIYAAGSGLVGHLAGFVTGDRVVVQGYFVGAVLVATTVGSVLTRLDVVADRVDPSGTVAETAAGRVRIAGRLPDAPVGSDRPPVRAGDRLSGVTWWDPQTEEHQLLATASGAGR